MGTPKLLHPAQKVASQRGGEQWSVRDKDGCSRTDGTEDSARHSLFPEVQLHRLPCGSHRLLHGHFSTSVYNIGLY